MIKINKDYLIPKYTIDKQLLDLVNEIDSLLKKVQSLNKDLIYPLGYREKYSTNNKNSNFIKAYEDMPKFDVFNKNDLFVLNGLLVNKEIKGYRKNLVWGKDLTYDFNNIQFIDAQFIEESLTNLNNWYINCKDHVLIKACAYKFAFIKIHPFRDGNGRTSRYILTSLMSKYNDKLRYFPFEELTSNRFVRRFSIKLQQSILENKTKNGQNDSYPMIYFYLSLLRNKLKEVVTGVKSTTVFN